MPSVITGGSGRVALGKRGLPARPYQYASLA